MAGNTEKAKVRQYQLLVATDKTPIDTIFYSNKDYYYNEISNERFKQSDVNDTSKFLKLDFHLWKKGDYITLYNIKGVSWSASDEILNTVYIYSSYDGTTFLNFKHPEYTISKYPKINRWCVYKSDINKGYRLSTKAEIDSVTKSSKPKLNTGDIYVFNQGTNDRYIPTNGTLFKVVSNDTNWVIYVVLPNQTAVIDEFKMPINDWNTYCRKATQQEIDEYNAKQVKPVYVQNPLPVRELPKFKEGDVVIDSDNKKWIVDTIIVIDSNTLNEKYRVYLIGNSININTGSKVTTQLNIAISDINKELVLYTEPKVFEPEINCFYKDGTGKYYYLSEIDKEHHFPYRITEFFMNGEINKNGYVIFPKHTKATNGELIEYCKSVGYTDKIQCKDYTAAKPFAPHYDNYNHYDFYLLLTQYKPYVEPVKSYTEQLTTTLFEQQDKALYESLGIKPIQVDKDVLANSITVMEQTKLDMQSSMCRGITKSTPKYKIGNRIKFIGYISSNIYYGTVSKVQGNYINVKFDKGDSIKYTINDEHLSKCEIQMIKNSRGFAVGDKVTCQYQGIIAEYSEATGNVYIKYNNNINDTIDANNPNLRLVSKFKCKVGDRVELPAGLAKVMKIEVESNQISVTVIYDEPKFGKAEYRYTNSFDYDWNYIKVVN